MLSDVRESAMTKVLRVALASHAQLALAQDDISTIIRSSFGGGNDADQSSDFRNLSTLMVSSKLPSTAMASICGQSTSRPMPFR